MLNGESAAVLGVTKSQTRLSNWSELNWNGEIELFLLNLEDLYNQYE